MSTTIGPRPAVLYARVSDDKGGQSRSVDQQLAALRVVADHEGWTVREEIRDDGLSASAYSTKARPGYARLSQVLQRGDVLAVWELSRATRQMSEWVVLRDLCIERGVLLYDGQRIVDLNDATDAYTTGIGMLTSEYESARTRSRILRSTDARAMSGNPHVGLGFGFVSEFDPQTGQRVWSLHPTEAPMIAQAVAEVLNGTMTPYRIAKRWNGAGVTTRAGNAWSASGVKLILLKPSIAAMRVHRGVVQPIRGNWPPIISEADHARLTHVLSTRARTTNPGRVPTSLLSSVAECAVCGGLLRRDVRPVIKHGERVGSTDRYRCPDNHVSIRADKLDGMVIEKVLNLIGTAQLSEWLAQTEATDDDSTGIAEHLERAAALEKRLTDAADAYAAGDLPIDLLRSITATLSGQIAEARAAASAATDDGALRSLLAMGTVETWGNGDLEDRRQFVRNVFRVALGRGGAVTIEPRR